MATFAAGCSTSRSLKMVAPSFVIVTSPMSSTSICRKHAPTSLISYLITAQNIALTSIILAKRSNSTRVCLMILGTPYLARQAPANS